MYDFSSRTWEAEAGEFKVSCVYTVTSQTRIERFCLRKKKEEEEEKRKKGVSLVCVRL